MIRYKTAWCANLFRDAQINQLAAEIAGHVSESLRRVGRVRLGIRGRRLRRGRIHVRLSGDKRLNVVIPARRTEKDGFWELKEGTKI